MKQGTERSHPYSRAFSRHPHESLFSSPFPAAPAYRTHAVDTCAVGREVVNWEQTLRQKWATLDFSDVKIQTNAVQHIFEAEVDFNDLDPKAVRVELYADGINDSDPIRLEMKHVRQLASASGVYI